MISGSNQSTSYICQQSYAKFPFCLHNNNNDINNWINYIKKKNTLFYGVFLEPHIQYIYTERNVYRQNALRNQSISNFNY